MRFLCLCWSSYPGCQQLIRGIVHLQPRRMHAGLTSEDDGVPFLLEASQGDRISGKISRAEVASVAVAALGTAASVGAQCPFHSLWLHPRRSLLFWSVVFFLCGLKRSLCSSVVRCCSTAA